MILVENDPRAPDTGGMPDGISAAAPAEAPPAPAPALPNPRLPDDPIVSVRDGFGRIAGHAPAAAIGRNCRRRQGLDTGPAQAPGIRRALAAQKDSSLDIVDCRTDGTQVLNRLTPAPLRDGGGKPQRLLDARLDANAGTLGPAVTVDVPGEETRPRAAGAAE